MKNEYEYINLSSPKKKNKSNLIYKQIILIIIFILLIIKKYNIKINNTKLSLNEILNSNKSLYQNMELDYINKTFVIIKDDNCKICGLMAYYKHYLVCITKYLNLGYIPIIDLLSFPNIFNSYNVSSIHINPWEYFFCQPFGYTLDNVLNKGKNIIYKNCNFRRIDLSYYIFNNNILIYYWHMIAMNYIPINNLIINEANIFINLLFRGSNNVLGILIRGTDYITKKPKKHPITPEPKFVIQDIKIMDRMNKYDYFFIATEDDIINKPKIIYLGKKYSFKNKNNYYIDFKNYNKN